METIPLSTMTLHSAVTPFAFAVITTSFASSPFHLPVTLPPLTVATAGSELVHVTAFLAPTIVGTSLIELPAPLVLSFISLIFREMALSRTVTLQDAIRPLASAVIIAVPACPAAVTTPLPCASAATVATASLSLLQVTFLSAPFTVAFNVTDLPAVSVLSAG